MKSESGKDMSVQKSNAEDAHINRPKKVHSPESSSAKAAQPASPFTDVAQALKERQEAYRLAMRRKKKIVDEEEEEEEEEEEYTGSASVEGLKDEADVSGESGGDRPGLAGLWMNGSNPDWTAIGLTAGALIGGVALLSSDGGGGGGSSGGGSPGGRGDTQAPAAPIINQVSSDGAINGAEKNAGVTVTGSAEANSSVKLVWGAATKTVIAGADGKWSATFANTEVPADGNTSISATATDKAGNVSAVGTHGVAVDTVIATPVIDQVAGDGVVSAAEQAAGVTVTGSAEAGSSVKLTWGAVEKTVTAGADGKWSATFASNEVPGNGQHPISATATDKAGNVSAAQTRPVTVQSQQLKPELSSDADKVDNLDVRSDIVLKSSLPVKLADGTWTIKVVNDANDTTKVGYRGENQDNSQTLTITVKDGVITSSTGGEVTLSPDGKSLRLNPKFDLDLGNKYHIEVPAGLLQTPDGNTNDAFQAGFSTVIPGAYNSTDANLGGAQAKTFDASGTLVDSQRWVDITGNGRFTTDPPVSINAGNGDYAFVVKDLSGAKWDDGTTVSGDGVEIDGDLNVRLNGFGKNDLVYFDQQDNSKPQNNLEESTFQGGNGSTAVPLQYVGGAGGSSQDERAQILIELENGLTTTNGSLSTVVNETNSSTGVVISG